MTECYTADGRRLELGREIAAGGEGSVYSLPGLSGRCAKVYHPPQRTADRRRKLEAMVARAPVDPTAAQGHRSIAWPETLLFADPGRRQFLGFVMPLLSPEADSALSYYQPDSRKTLHPGFNFLYLMRAGRNLAAALAALHAAGYRVGDLNQSNVRITPEALVTLIDCDSFQVPAPDGTVFRCTVGMPEYTAPELVGVSWDTTDRTPESDAFALAVMLFQLLMLGFHPFSGQWLGQGEPPPAHERIRSGLYAYGGSGLMAPPRRAPDIRVLPPAVREAFRRAFVDSASDPSKRPLPPEWVHLLDTAEGKLRRCTTNADHLYPEHLRACPWCEIARKHGTDPFPRPAGLQIALPAAHSKVSRQQAIEMFRDKVRTAAAGGVLTEAHERHLRQEAEGLGLGREFPRLLDRMLQEVGAVRGVPAAKAARLQVTPESLSFRDLHPGSGPQVQTVRYTNSGTEALQANLRADPPGPVRVEPAVLTTNGGEFRVVVDTRALQWGARYRQTVRIDYNGPDSPLLLPVEVRTAPRPAASTRVDRIGRALTALFFEVGVLIAVLALLGGAHPVAVLGLERLFQRGAILGLVPGPTGTWVTLGTLAPALVAVWWLAGRRWLWMVPVYLIGMAVLDTVNAGAGRTSLGYHGWVAAASVASAPALTARLTHRVCRALAIRSLSRATAERAAMVALTAVLAVPPLLVSAGLAWNLSRAPRSEGWLSARIPPGSASSAPAAGEERAAVFVGPGSEDPERIRGVQTALRALGYSPGRADGIWGPRTEAAVKAFQKKHGWPETGQLTVAQWEKMQAEVKAAGAGKQGGT